MMTKFLVLLLYILFCLRLLLSRWFEDYSEANIVYWRVRRDPAKRWSCSWRGSERKQVRLSFPCVYNLRENLDPIVNNCDDGGHGHFPAEKRPMFDYETVRSCCATQRLFWFVLFWVVRLPSIGLTHESLVRKLREWDRVTAAGAHLSPSFVLPFQSVCSAKSVSISCVSGRREQLFAVNVRPGIIWVLWEG